MKKISIALAVYNEANNLARCLEAVAPWADEIIIVDGGSTDDTVKIAQNFKAKVIITDNPPIFHLNKQKALEACSGEWILQLDADEVVSTELKEELLATARKKADFMGYYIPRKNFFWGRWMRKGGQYPDYVMRFFVKGKGSFPAQSVHEQIEIDGAVGYLKNPLLHYPYADLSEYWLKANRYSLLAARELARKHTPINFFTLISFFVIKPWSTFLNLYIRHLGFIDGWAGLLFAIFSSWQHQLAFIKYLYGKDLD